MVDAWILTSNISRHV